MNEDYGTSSQAILLGVRPTYLRDENNTVSGPMWAPTRPAEDDSLLRTSYEMPQNCHSYCTYGDDAVE